MKMPEIKALAKALGIKASRAKKADLVRKIQSAENNTDCFATQTSAECGQEDCLWRQDCLALDKKMMRQ